MIKLGVLIVSQLTVIVAQAEPSKASDWFTGIGATTFLGVFALAAYRAWQSNREVNQDAREGAASRIGSLEADRNWWRKDSYDKTDIIAAKDKRIRQLERFIRSKGEVPPDEEP